MRAFGTAGVVFLTIVVALGGGDGWQRMAAASVLGFLALAAIEFADEYAKREIRRRR